MDARGAGDRCARARKTPDEEPGRPLEGPGAPHGGVTLALGSALLFGLSTPFVQRFGRDVGTFATGGLFYVGAALSALVAVRRRSGEPPLRCRHARRSSS